MLKINKLLFLFSFCSLFAFYGEREWEKVTYPLTNDAIDVVIPSCAKDLETLEICIRGIKENGKNIRRIIVVSDHPLTDSAEWFDEARYPFSKREIALEIFKGDSLKAEEFLSSPQTRIGWIFQQFLKLYSFLAIPDLSPNILILDSDVVFIKPTAFIDDLGHPYFAPATENTREYLEFMGRLLPGLKRVHAGTSGISHHMLFQKPILEDLFHMIEEKHKIEPWKALCRCIDLNLIYASSLSEYEIYFNFCFSRTHQAILRPLRSMNLTSIPLLSRYRHPYFDFITSHAWRRELEKELENAQTN